MTMKTKLNLSLMTLLAVFMFVACDSDFNGAAPNVRTDLVSFTFVGDKPIVASPDEEVY